MPQPAPEFTDYAINHSKKAKSLLSQLDPAVRASLNDLAFRMAENPEDFRRDSEAQSADGRILLFEYKDPELGVTLEVTYEIDAEHHVINFIHFAASVLDSLVKERKIVFISYSHADEKWLAELRKFLKPLEQKASITIWDDTKIAAGAKWQEEIKNKLASARAAILLVSQDFLSSDFIANNELPPLLQAANEQGLRIFWLALSASTVDDTDIMQYEAAMNDPSRPLDKRTPAERNEVFKGLYNQLKELV